MEKDIEIGNYELIQNLVNKIAVKEYQISQLEVVNGQLQKQLEELQNKEEEGE